MAEIGQEDYYVDVCYSCLKFGTDFRFHLESGIAHEAAFHNYVPMGKFSITTTDEVADKTYRNITMLFQT